MEEKSEDTRKFEADFERLKTREPTDVFSYKNNRVLYKVHGKVIIDKRVEDLTAEERIIVKKNLRFWTGCLLLVSMICIGYFIWVFFFASDEFASSNWIGENSTYGQLGILLLIIGIEVLAVAFFYESWIDKKLKMKPKGNGSR